MITLLINISFYLLLLVLALILLWLLAILPVYLPLKRVAGPIPLPIVGNVLFTGGVTQTLNIFNRLLVQYKTKMVRLFFMNQCLLVVTDPKLLEFVLNSNQIIEKSDRYRFLQRWLGTGLLTGTGEKWKSHRKIINPTFSITILEQFLHAFDRTTDILISKLKSEVGNQSTEISKHISLCALDTICETAMGTTINAQLSSDSSYVKSVDTMCQIIQIRSISPFLGINFLYRCSKTYQKEVQALEVLHGFTNPVIERRKEQLLKSKSNDELVDAMGIKRKKAFLDMLLEAQINGQPLSDEDIREEVNTFMFAGHDTSSSAMSFALFEIANRPEIQAKIVSEIEGFFGDDKLRSVTYQELQDMKYLEMVIKETLRMYPPVPVYVRRLKNDVKFNDITLPAHVNLAIYAYGLHHDPDNFPEPNQFNPERFSGANISKIKPFTYLPFSAGPRNCIGAYILLTGPKEMDINGQKFAMLEMKATICKILKHYKLEPVEPKYELRVSAETVLKATNGIFVKISARK